MPSAKSILVILGIFLLLLIVGDRMTKFKGPTVPIRRRKGVGDFGAFRSAHPTKPHQGQDFFAVPGQTVYAPIGGTIRIANPYPGDSRFGGVEISGSGRMSAYKVKIFYLFPLVNSGDVVFAGEPIGVVQDLSLKYGAGFADQNHIHVEVRRLGQVVNPDSYFAKDTPGILA